MAVLVLPVVAVDLEGMVVLEERLVLVRLEKVEQEEMADQVDQVVKVVLVLLVMPLIFISHQDPR